MHDEYKSKFVQTFVKEFSITINNSENYTIILEQTPNNLEITLENEEPNYYIGKFTFSDIEDLTKKSKSYKKYDVFIKMLLSALSNKQKLASIDIISQNLINNVNCKFKSNSLQKSQEIISEQLDKKYLVLTYDNEFENSLYPIPLVFDSNPGKELTFRTIRRQAAEKSILMSTIKRLNTKEISKYDTGELYHDSKNITINSTVNNILNENKNLKEMLKNKIPLYNQPLSYYSTEYNTNNMKNNISSKSKDTSIQIKNIKKQIEIPIKTESNIVPVELELDDLGKYENFDDYEEKTTSKQTTNNLTKIYK